MIRRALVLVAVVAFLPGLLRADDKIEAKDVIEKAIKAHGGKEALEKYKVAHMTGSGKVYAGGQEIEFTVKGVMAQPDKVRSEIRIDIMGQTIEVVRVFNSNQGWEKVMGEVMEFDEEKVKDAQQEVYQNNLEGIAPLASDKDLKITVIGEEQVEGKPAIGLKVSKEGRKDVRLYFDKESGLLVKMSAKGKDLMGQEVDADTYYSDYKDVQGQKIAMKQLVKHGDEKFLEALAKEIKLEEKVDSSLFNKPE